MSGVLDWLADAGIVAAILAWIGRWIASRRSLDEERRGLLRLLRVEMNLNRPVLADIAKFCDENRFGNEMNLNAPLRTSTWEQTRVRLTQILEGSLSFDLFVYYSTAESLNRLLTPYESEATRREMVPDMLQGMRQVDDAFGTWMNEYLYGDMRHPWWWRRSGGSHTRRRIRSLRDRYQQQRVWESVHEINQHGREDGS